MSRNKLLAGAFIAAVVSGALSFGLGFAHELSIRTEVPGCFRTGTVDIQKECVFRIIQHELLTRGVKAAFHVYSLAYESSAAFAENGCHSHVHRIGDLAYYKVYRGTGDLSLIDLPQETTACGYGFFHGFLEHYIQDNPTPEKATQICDYLTARLGDRMGDIELICYHGAGHGLMLGSIERVSKKDWGKLGAFVTEPARKCKALPKANATDVEQCYEGIFNIVVDYMTLNQYGFSYDNEHPFAVCGTAAPVLQRACIYEMAQKIAAIADNDPVAMIKIVSQIRDESNRILAYRVGVSGVIQGIIATDGAYQALEKRCESAPSEYLGVCVSSIVWGLFEHGDPQHEYEKPLAFCATDVPESQKSTCYSAITPRLIRFYDEPTRAKVCDQFPKEYQNLCVGRLK